MKKTIINIYDIVGNSLCIASGDGHKLFVKIKKELEEGNKVIISFLNVESLTSAFLNSAIGQLYGVFPYKKIKESLSVKDIEKDDASLLRRVIDTAKQYFQDPDVIKAIRQEILGDEDE